MSSYDGVIQQEYVGKWIGYKLYPADSSEEGTLLADANRSMTIDISADGAAELYMSANGVEDTHTYQMEAAENGAGYSLRDDNGTLVAAVEHKAGERINLLYLLMPDSDGEFFITACYREDEVALAEGGSESEAATESASGSSVDDAASLCKTPGAAKLVELGRSGDGWEQATPAMQRVSFGRLSVGAGREVWQLSTERGFEATMSQAEFEDIVLALATQMYGDSEQGKWFVEELTSDVHTRVEGDYGAHGPCDFSIDGINYCVFSGFSIAGSSRTGYSLMIVGGESYQQGDEYSVYEYIHQPPYHPLTSADMEEIFG